MDYSISETVARVAIRPALMEDSPILADLSCQLGYPSTGAQTAIRLSHLLNKQDHIILVAVLPDDRIIGWMHLVISERLECDAFLEIAALIIGHSSRNQGIGKQMVLAALQWAAEHHLSNVVVRSNIIREDAHRFYKRHGFSYIKTQRYFSYTFPTKE